MQIGVAAAPQEDFSLPAKGGDSAKANQGPGSEGQAADRDIGHGKGAPAVEPPQQAESRQQEGLTSAAEGHTAVPGAHQYTINGKGSLAAILGQLLDMQCSSSFINVRISERFGGLDQTANILGVPKLHPQFGTVESVSIIVVESCSKVLDFMQQRKCQVQSYSHLPTSARIESLLASQQRSTVGQQQNIEGLHVPAGFKVAEGVHTETGGAKEDAEQREAERR